MRKPSTLQEKRNKEYHYSLHLFLKLTLSSMVTPTSNFKHLLLCMMSFSNNIFYLHITNSKIFPIHHNCIVRYTLLSTDSDALGVVHPSSNSCPKIVESFRLEKFFKIIKSNHKPNTAKSTTKPCC